MHGDIESPKSIVLSQRSYSQMIYNSPEYRKLLENIFLNYSLLFIGYSGNDPNVESIINKISITGTPQNHFVLANEGTFTQIEKKRHLKDRNIKVIEYVDYFNLHNHIDTFFLDLLKEVCSRDVFEKIPKRMRTKIYIFYDKIDLDDGEFLWHYLFKYGAITFGDEAQRDQYNQFINKFSANNTFIDFMICFLGNTDIKVSNPFIKKLNSLVNKIQDCDFEIIIVSLNKNKKMVSERYRHINKFFVRKNFIDIDLENLKNYIINQLE